MLKTLSTVLVGFAIAAFIAPADADPQSFEDLILADKTLALYIHQAGMMNQINGASYGDSQVLITQIGEQNLVSLELGQDSSYSIEQYGNENQADIVAGAHSSLGIVQTGNLNQLIINAPNDALKLNIRMSGGEELQINRF